jgi:hypothetical protein
VKNFGDLKWQDSNGVVSGDVLEIDGTAEYHLRPEVAVAKWAVAGVRAEGLFFARIANPDLTAGRMELTEVKADTGRALRFQADAPDAAVCGVGGPVAFAESLCVQRLIGSHASGVTAGLSLREEREG